VDDSGELVILFYGCQGQLANEEKPGCFEVLNWTGLLAEALGADTVYRLEQAVPIAT